MELMAILIKILTKMATADSFYCLAFFLDLGSNFNRPILQTLGKTFLKNDNTDITTKSNCYTGFEILKNMGSFINHVDIEESGVPPNVHITT